MSAKLAVLMTAYNAAPFIGDALASLLQQRPAAQLDIIVVNDGSTDATGEIVSALARHAPEVRLINGSNGGIARAKNTAINALRPDTDFVSLLDADDLSPPGRFARDLQAFAEDPKLDFLYGYARLFKGIGPDRLAPNPAGPYSDMRGVHLGTGVMRAALFRQVGHFDEALKQAEDVDFLFRMLDLNPKIRLVDDICLYYRRHRNNVTNDRAVTQSHLTRALLARLRRRRNGENVRGIPDGFFVGMERLADFDWWGGDDSPEAAERSVRQ